MKKLAMLIIVILIGITLYNQGDEKIVYNLWWHDCPNTDRAIPVAGGEILPGGKITLNEYLGKSVLVHFEMKNGDVGTKYIPVPIHLNPCESIILHLPITNIHDVSKIIKGRGL